MYLPKVQVQENNVPCSSGCIFNNCSNHSASQQASIAEDASDSESENESDECAELNDDVEDILRCAFGDPDYSVHED